MLSLEDDSLANSIKKLERYVLNLPLAKSMNTMNKASREAMIALTDSVAEARDNITRYVVSDDILEKQQKLEASIEHIKLVNDNILMASSYDLLDAIDVAQMSAATEMIKERLQ